MQELADSYSKKELEQMFGITRYTVYRSLKHARLDTAKRRYSNDELFLFQIVRNLFRQGCTAKQVDQKMDAYFEQRSRQKEVYLL